MAVTRRYKDELLVHGYVRENDSRYPVDIMNICLKWYHIESFLFSAGDCLEINEEKDIVTHKGGQYNSCYGSIIMPSTSPINIKYEYELKILDDEHEISIGIDESKCEHINEDFSGQRSTKNYSYYSPNGTQYNWTTGEYAGHGLNYGESYSKDDVIKMCYNPYNSTLQFWKNGINQGIIESIHSDQNLSYRLCVYMGSVQGTSVKLVL